MGSDSTRYEDCYDSNLPNDCCFIIGQSLRELRTGPISPTGVTMSPEKGTIEQAGLVEAVGQAADCIVITDRNGKIQYVNPAFTAMTGYTSAEVVGRETRVLKSGHHPAAFYE